MDINNVPIGYTLGLAMTEDRRERFENLTEAEKEHIILECKDARTDEERERVLNRLDGSWF